MEIPNTKRKIFHSLLLKILPKFPIRTLMILPISCWLKYIRSEIRAEKNMPIMIPESSNFVLLKNPPRWERYQTKIMVRIAPPNPINGIKMNNPEIPAKMLPKAAPDEIPKMYGSARGLLSMTWKVKPTPAKMNPVRKVSINLGNLTDIMIWVEGDWKFR